MKGIYLVFDCQGKRDECWMVLLAFLKKFLVETGFIQFVYLLIVVIISFDFWSGDFEYLLDGWNWWFLVDNTHLAALTALLLILLRLKLLI